MFDPRVLLFLGALYGTFYVADHYVVKPTKKVVQVTKTTVKKIGHGLKKVF